MNWKVNENLCELTSVEIFHSEIIFNINVFPHEDDTIFIVLRDSSGMAHCGEYLKTGKTQKIVLRNNT